jgi:hypothetical protein
MIELVKGSTELSNNSAIKYAANLLRHYSFELDEFTIDQLLSYWSDNYPVNWVRLAAIEALYQGRYKAVSVEQILVLWKRRGQPVHHFNHEFERLVCDKFPRDLLSPADPGQSRKKPFPTGKPSVGARVGPFQYQSLLQQLQPQSQSPDLLLEKSQQNHPLAESAIPLSTANPPQLNPASLTATENEAKEKKEQGNKEQNQPAEDQLPSGHGSEPLQTEISPDQPQAEIDQAPGKVELPQAEAGSNNSSSEVDAASDREQFPSKPEIEQPLFVAESPVELSSEASDSAQQLSILLFTVEHILPSLNLTAPSLKPKLKLQLTTFYQPKWLIEDGSKHPIHQFTPTPESSDFHSKLRSVAQSPEEG